MFLPVRRRLTRYRGYATLCAILHDSNGSSRATKLIKTGRGNGPTTPGNRRMSPSDAVLTPAEGAQASFPKDEPHL